MAAQQTSYALEPTATGFQGGLSDTRNILVDARRNDLAASAQAVYGLGVCKSTATDGLGFGLCGTARQFLGVLVHSMDLEKQTTGLPNGEFGNVMRQGRVWVKVVEAVTQDSTVKVFVADHSGTIANAVEGAFGDTVVSTKTATLLNARYLGAGAAGDLVELELGPNAVLLVADA